MTRTNAARVQLINGLRAAKDIGHGRFLSDVVQENLTRIWEGSHRSEWIYIRSGFISGLDRPEGPLLPRLIQSKGLQLRLLLLMIFNEQCTLDWTPYTVPGRRVTPKHGDTRLSWLQLVLTDAAPARGTGRTASDLRARQISEAIRGLEKHRVLTVPRDRQRQGRRSYDLQRLKAEDGTSAEYGYTKPDHDHAVPVSRHFFTNLWLFALTDSEIATYLVLSLLRWRHAREHKLMGVYLTAERRQTEFRLSRHAWRSTELLHRFGVVDRRPDPNRNFLTGKVANFAAMWADKEVRPLYYTFNDEALKRPAVETVYQILTRPNANDAVRRLGLPPIPQWWQPPLDGLDLLPGERPPRRTRLASYDSRLDDLQHEINQRRWDEGGEE
ncbi:hypothetical protein [Actinoplanes sp. G11-F43]|uniref:hypothetical protein n=1 Tax=Actinoplanes sp. G11-F43 TaxID=3424130 RepID=UPI003D329039